MNIFLDNKGKNSFNLDEWIESNKRPISRASILCLDDIINCLGDKINNYSEKFLPLIMKKLSDNNIDENLKPNLLLF